MDELLSTFLEAYYSSEMQEEIAKSFDLFDFYEYHQAYSGFIDIANNQGLVSTDDLKDQFTQELHTCLNYILGQHTLVLTPDATIDQKNQILTALAHLQKLEDYTGVIRMLESFASDEEQLATILADSTLMDSSEILSVIESFSPSILKTLKEYIYIVEESAQTKEEPRYDLVANLKLFASFVKKPTIGAAMAENGALLGERFISYLPYIDGALVSPKDPAATALNILSLLYISNDGYNAPLLVYRKYSYQILHDLNLVSQVEAKLLEHIAQYTEFKKAHNETTRLFKAGSAA